MTYNQLVSKEYGKHMVAQFFFADSKLPVPEEYREEVAHVQHCKELQNKAAAKQQAEMWAKFWGGR